MVFEMLLGGSCRSIPFKLMGSTRIPRRGWGLRPHSQAQLPDIDRDTHPRLYEMEEFFQACFNFTQYRGEFL